MSEKPDRIANRYELIARLGEGGMGVVWRARDTRLNRNVAVKLLPAAAVGSENARARLLREAQAAATLEHDAVIRVYDVGETEDGGAFLVMELVRGGTLREALEKRSLGFAGVVHTIVAAARGLAAAHAAGIIHRDVKPDNIMIRDDGRVVVVDFGVAKPVATALLATAAETVGGVTQKSLTAAGQLVGTPAYLAPEQARGAEVGPGTDQFALAVTAYEALTGRLPWNGAGVVEIVASILRDDPAPVTALVPLPPAFDDIIGRALAKEPADRHPDMAAFADALESLESELAAEPIDRSLPNPNTKKPNVSTPGGRSTPRTASAMSVAAPPADEARPGAPSTSAHPRLLLYGVVACALLGIGYGAMHARMDGRTTTSTIVPSGTDTVACPSFAAAGMDEAWLGTSAATLACDRMQVARGGGDARTITPAELSDVPPEIIQPIHREMFEDAGIRDAHLATAKKRATRWLDGRVERQRNMYTVEIALRDSNDAELARGKGTALELFDAVRDATGPAIAALGPLDSKELVTARDWLDATPDDALDLLDMRTAILIEDLTSVRERCDVVAKKTTLAPRVVYLARLLCARKLRTPKPEGPAPAIDESSPGALLTTTLARGTDGGATAVKERAMRLEKAAESAPTAEAKARLLAVAAEVYNSIADRRAREVARMAIQASPKAPDWRANAWHRLAFASEADEALGAAIGAWQSWEPVTQSITFRRGVLGGKEASTRALHRSFLLSQRSYYANAYGEHLLDLGQVEAARGIAELTRDDVLRIDILLGEAKYAEALKTIPPLIAALPATEEKASVAFRLAHHGVQAANVLGRSPDFVDDLVRRYVDAEPHAVVDGVVPFASLVTSCCFAPKTVGKRCIERLQRLRADSRLPTIFNGVDRVLEGASFFVADDFVGATRAWRPLLRAPGWVQDSLREAMSFAFDRANEPELAEEVDRAMLETIALPRPADLSWVRAARRAMKRGDRARAKTFAQAVVEKWRFADDDIPAVAEMKAMLTKL